MEDIKHTYTIQWVGPLTYDEYKEYVKGTDVLFLAQNVIDMIIEKNCKSIKDILNNDIQVNGIIYSPIFGDLEY